MTFDKKMEILSTFLGERAYGEWQENASFAFVEVLDGLVFLEDVIACAFHWRYTTQGHEYWGVLDLQYREWLRKEGYLSNA